MAILNYKFLQTLSRKRTAAQNYYPNLVIDDITLLSNDSVKIDVSNDGGIPTSKETELALFSDGSILGYDQFLNSR